MMHFEPQRGHEGDAGHTTIELWTDDGRHAATIYAAGNGITITPAAAHEIYGAGAAVVGNGENAGEQTAYIEVRRK